VNSRLHTTEYGDRGPVVLFCHGLFGQGRNWTSIAKTLAADGFRCRLVDLPNHGRSAWTEHFSYGETAELVAPALGDEPAIVVGHSLGGKVAMRLALDRPDRVGRLCVVDMAPVRYQRMSTFADYIAGMQSIDLATLRNRAEAAAQLEDAVPDPTVRGFLLQNLRHDTAPGGRGWFWQPNLDLFDRELDRVGDWTSPTDDRGRPMTYEGPTLWIAGERSDYVSGEQSEAMRALFTATRLVTVKGAGHWVHSEQPEVFTAVLRQFASAAR